MILSIILRDSRENIGCEVEFEGRVQDGWNGFGWALKNQNKDIGKLDF